MHTWEWPFCCLTLKVASFIGNLSIFVVTFLLSHCIQLPITLIRRKIKQHNILTFIFYSFPIGNIKFKVQKCVKEICIMCCNQCFAWKTVTMLHMTIMMCCKYSKKNMSKQFELQTNHICYISWSEIKQKEKAFNIVNKDDGIYLHTSVNVMFLIF